MFGPIPSDNIYLLPSSLFLGNFKKVFEKVNNSSVIQLKKAKQWFARFQENSPSANVTSKSIQPQNHRKGTVDDWATCVLHLYKDFLGYGK